MMSMGGSGGEIMVTGKQEALKNIKGVVYVSQRAVSQDCRQG